MNTQVVLVGLYRYLNIPTRILRPLIDKLERVNAHTIFYKNYDANIFNLPSPKEEEIFVDTIKQLNPQIVGISVLSPYVEIAKRLTYLIKKNSSSLVVWGGVGPTISPKVHIKETDIICVGEGERAFSELTEALRDGKDYKKIKNLWINDGAKVVINPIIKEIIYSLLMKFLVLIRLGLMNLSLGIKKKWAYRLSLNIIQKL